MIDDRKDLDQDLKNELGALRCTSTSNLKAVTDGHSGDQDSSQCDVRKGYSAIYVLPSGVKDHSNADSAVKGIGSATTYRSDTSYKI